MKLQNMTRTALEHAAQQHQAALLRLRHAIGLIGFFLPLALLAGTLLPGIAMENSISEFYFTPMRDIFVLAMSGIGVFLIAYHGHDPAADDWLTDWRVSTLSGATALMVALIPTLCDAQTCYAPLSIFDDLIEPETVQLSLHFGAAGLFLTSLAVMCIWLFTRSDDPNPPPAKRRRNRIYRICGWVVLAMVAALLVFKLILKPVGHGWDQSWHFTFWVESIAVWAFGIAWLVKGEALKGARTAFLYGPPDA